MYIPLSFRARFAFFYFPFTPSSSLDELGKSIDQQSGSGVNEVLLLVVQSMRCKVFAMRGKDRWEGLVLIGEFDGGISLVCRALSHIGLCR